MMTSDYQVELFLGIGEPFGNPFLTVSPFLMYFFFCLDHSFNESI